MIITIAILAAFMILVAAYLLWVCWEIKKALEWLIIFRELWQSFHKIADGFRKGNRALIKALVKSRVSVLEFGQAAGKIHLEQ